MSIQLVLLKSGEEVIADVKELRDDSDDLLSYVFKNPYTIKIKTAQVLMEGKGSPKHEAVYYRWMSLSKDTDIIVNKDWIVCITDPIDTIKTSYEERLNGRRSNDSNESSDRRDGGTSGSGSGGAIESDSSVTLSKSNNSDIGD